MRVPLILVASAMPLLSLLAARVGSAQDTIRLRPGFQKIIDRHAPTRLSIGNPEIVEAQPLGGGDGILVVGKKEGETDLVVWERGTRTEWRIEVRPTAGSVAEEAKAFAGAFPGLQVTEAGSEVLLDGVVANLRDRAAIEEYARAHPGVLLRLSRPEENRTMLQYDLKIIEISRGETSQLGIKWPDAVPVKGAVVSSTQGGRTVTVGSDFEARLGLLLADGKARILSNPRLACESGEDALFLAGGEIPIVIITPETRTVEWKTYGIILRIRPTMLAGGKIGTQVTAEVSTVDHASGSADVPGFLTRRVSTHFSTAPGETVMLSGLVKSEMAKDIAKVPLLGQIPVIGELFKSRSFRENQTELAIFITPTEVQANSGREAGEWDRKAAGEKEAMRFRLLD
ncbi:MAG: type II and III secretion system protein family protein [Verrucomicrobiota bacterium]